MSDLHLQMFNIKEAMRIWSELSVEVLKEELDVQGMKIANLKEDYISRRKILASKVRGFFKAASSEGDESQLTESCKSLIQDFKLDFDNLSDAAKFSEFCFMDAYKKVRNLQDPQKPLEGCLVVCLKALDRFGSINIFIDFSRRFVHSSRFS